MSEGPRNDKPQTADLGDVKDELTGTAGDIKEAAVEQGRQLYQAAKGQAAGFLDSRKDLAAQSVSDIAASIRETGESLEDRPNIKAFVGSAADGLEQLADSIRDRSFAEIYGMAEDYARRSPLTVVAGAAIAGFLVARVLKSTAEDLTEAADTHRRRAAGAAAQASRKARASTATGATASSSAARSSEPSRTATTPLTTSPSAPASTI